MAWHIIFFLKSLRSLEEFRKNPHAKIPPKSLSINFESLGQFKNPIFIRKRIFLRFRPNRPSGQPARPLSPASHRPSLPQATRALGPSRPVWQWRIGQNTFPFSRCATRRRCLLPMSPPSGAHLSVLSSTSRRPIPATLPLLSTTPLHPASTLRYRGKQLTSPP
jgi:hypothetical protein